VKRIALVTDSTADLTPALIKDWNVHVIPLKIRFAGEEFYDGELTAEEFYQRLRNASALPVSSQPAPEVKSGRQGESTLIWICIIKP
jgi:fatty acid-binding protein DegV